MPENLPGPIFMSYSRRDDDVMRRTTAFLRGKGVAVWVDNEKLVPGTAIWEAEIEKAIRAAAAVIVFMSPDSKDSEWVRREITLADQYRKRIFPILVRGDEDSSITLRLVTRQFVDLRGNEKSGLNDLFQALSQFLGELLPQATANFVQGTAQQATSYAPETPQIMKSASSLVPWLALGWGIIGMIAGYLWSEFDDLGGEVIAGTFGGAVGGLITALVLRSERVVSNQISTFRSIFAWAVGMSIAWLLGWEISDGSAAAGLGMAFAASVGLAGTLGFGYLRSQWQRSAIILFAWFIGGAIIWIIAKNILIDALAMNDQGAAWAIGTAIGWTIGAFVMGWQLLNKARSS